MPSTHISLNYHVVFSTKDRLPQIEPEWRPRLHQYLSGIVRSLGGSPLIAGGVADHVHMLFGLKATHSVAEVLRNVKGSSSHWLHETFASRLSWQDGYGAFTVCRSHLDSVADYIAKQEDHHRTRNFQEEYLELLKANGVEYDPRFLW
jgi:REP element-mobilizing transposase RayT